jgi:hypothetical protein
VWQGTWASASVKLAFRMVSELSCMASLLLDYEGDSRRSRGYPIRRGVVHPSNRANRSVAMERGLAVLATQAPPFTPANQAGLLQSAVSCVGYGDAWCGRY